MIGLQWLCLSLKIAIRKLPDSAIKKYLLLEIVKPIKLKSVTDFKQLHNKIFNIVDIATMENFNEISEWAKVLKLLEDIKNVLEEVIYCDKENRKNIKVLANSGDNGEDKVRLVAVG